MLLAFFFVFYVGNSGWDDFDLIDYPGFTILVLAATYCLAVAFFNRTTTTITDTTFAVRHGPIPCPLPPDHVRDIADVRLITYDIWRTIHVSGGTLYYARAFFRDGRRADFFTVGSDEELADALVKQLREWVRDKQAARTRSYTPDAPELSDAEMSRADRWQRLKVALAVLGALAGLAATVALSEYAAAHSYHPARQAARRERQYEAFSKQLHSPENYAVWLSPLTGKPATDDP